MPRSRTLSNLFVLLPTGVDAYVVLRHEGTIGVLTSFESIFVCGAMLYGVIKAGRTYRAGLAGRGLHLGPGGPGVSTGAGTI